MKNNLSFCPSWESTDHGTTFNGNEEMWSKIRYILFFSHFLLSMSMTADLYGVNVRPVAPFGSTCSKPVVDSSLIHRCLPDELLFEVWWLFVLLYIHEKLLKLIATFLFMSRQKVLGGLSSIFWCILLPMVLLGLKL